MNLEIRFVQNNCNPAPKGSQFSQFRSQCPHNFQHILPVNRIKCKDSGCGVFGVVSRLKWQTGASVPSDVIDTWHPQSPVWPSTSFHTDAPCTGPLRPKSKQQRSLELRWGTLLIIPCFLFTCFFCLNCSSLHWNMTSLHEASGLSSWDAGLCLWVRVCASRSVGYTAEVCEGKRCVSWELTFSPIASGVTVHPNGYYLIYQ